ncbi:MAG: proline dehydrogenase family protein [Armatimonadetes bacterium]|nr:proline dehydrogenase family protein [Armatimonadota bacterium]
MLVRSLILKTSALPPVERMVRHSRTFKPLVKRFIAGDTLDEALVPTIELLQRGFFVSLDYLGENATSAEEANRASAMYLSMVRRMFDLPEFKPGNPATYSEGKPENLNISIKLTQCGLDISDDFAYGNYLSVVEFAAEKGGFVRVDMEASGYTDRTVKLVQKMHATHPNTGTVLQSYLHRTDDDLNKLMPTGIRLRLVKGAYLEPPEVAFPDKFQVDEQYLKQAKLMLKEATYPAIATHDEGIIRDLNAFAEKERVDKSKFEYQMLYGIRRDLQESLRSEGYNVRVYIPFGDSWYPYFSRRLAERPANTLFILKSMFRG